MKDRAEQIHHAMLTRLRPRHLALLQVLGDQRTLSCAAEALGITQPAVTKTLREIEDIFMARLFERTRKGVVPTHAGRVALNLARAALGDLEASARELAAVHAGALGRVRIGVIPHLPGALLDAAVGLLLGQAPRLSVAVREDTTDDLVGSLLAHELDCAICRPYFDGAETALMQEPLYRQSPALVVSKASRMRLARGPLRWQRLGRLDWILPPPNTPIRRTVNAIFASAGVSPPTPLVETYSLKTISAVLRTLPDAITIVASEVGAELAAQGAGAVLPQEFVWDLPPICLLRTLDQVNSEKSRLLAAAIMAAAERYGRGAD